MHQIIYQRIHLEICPSCNVQTGVYETYADHPINRLFRAGVSIGINTDTRTITNTTLSQEYQRLHDTFGWDRAHFRRCNLDAIDAAFLEPETRVKIRQRLLAAYGSPA